MTAPTAWFTPSTRGALQLALNVLLALALFAVLQVLAARHNLRFDLTPNQLSVLSPQAVQVAGAFDGTARITAFYSSQEGDQRRDMLDLLEQFRAAAPQIEFRLLDLDRSPGLAKRYGVSSYNTGVLEVGERLIPLRSIDESEIANALLALSQHRTRTLCFVIGHGERSPQSNDERSGYSDVSKSLERENFRIETLSTVPMEGVPERCAMVVLAGPSHDLLPGESDVLTRFLRDGGRVLMLIDPDAPRSVLDFLAAAGIDAGHDLIIDEGNRFIGADSFMPHVMRFRTEIYGNHLDSPAVLSLARTVRPIETPPAGIQVLSIATTSPESWALVDAGGAPEEKVQFRPDIDQPGPLSVAVLVNFLRAGATPTPQAEDEDEPLVPPPGQLIAIGDSDFATNFYVNLLGNKDFFMSTVAVLSQDPELIAVRKKGMPRGTISPISLSANQGRLIFWITTVAQPVGFLLIGAAVALHRRRQRGGR